MNCPKGRLSLAQKILMFVYYSPQVTPQQETKVLLDRSQMSFFCRLSPSSTGKSELTIEIVPASLTLACSGKRTLSASTQQNLVMQLKTRRPNSIFRTRTTTEGTNLYCTVIALWLVVLINELLYRPLSFFTWQHITTELQPNLNKQLKQLLDQKANSGAGSQASHSANIDDQIKAVNASIEGWNEILGRQVSVSLGGE